MADPAPVAGWYGKSPSAGDFVSRRLSKSIIDRLHAWLQSGMVAIREQAPDEWPILYAAAPVWSALIPSGVVAASPYIGAVGASFDRVGRRFPLCVLVSIDGAAPLARVASLGDFCARLCRLVARGCRSTMSSDEFDGELATLVSASFPDAPAAEGDLSDIMEVLGDAALDNDLTTVPLSAGAAFPWPNLAREFDPTAATSYWWNSGVGRLQRGFTHAGPLDVALFVTLFGIAQSDDALVPTGNGVAAKNS